MRCAGPVAAGPGRQGARLLLGGARGHSQPAGCRYARLARTCQGALAKGKQQRQHTGDKDGGRLLQQDVQQLACLAAR
jgi:hypothetical protein